MARVLPRPWTVEDFIAFEAQESERYEFVDGVIVMMTGGSIAHSVIKLNLGAELRAALRGGPCRAFLDDVKVVTGAAVMYPDVVVSCVPQNPNDDRVDRPSVVIEVLSPSTETHDRVRKWRNYQSIPSLEHFVLVAQEERRAEVFTRTSTGFALEIIEPPEVIQLSALGVRLPLDLVYEDSGS